MPCFRDYKLECTLIVSDKRLNAKSFVRKPSELIDNVKAFE